MVALLTRLQIKLTLRSYRGDTSRIIALAVVSFFGAGLLMSFLGAAILLRGAEVGQIGSVVTCLFSFVTLLWPVALVLLGSNDPLAPTRFVLFPVRARELQPGLVVATLFTIGGVATSILTVGYVLAWSARPLTLILGTVCGLAGLAFSVLLARTLTAAISATLASRRFREASFIIVGVLAFLPAFGGQFLGRWFSAGSGTGSPVHVLDRAAVFLGWSPFGWAWSLPGEVWSGAWAVVAAKSGLFAVTCWVLCRCGGGCGVVRLGRVGGRVRSGWLGGGRPGGGGRRGSRWRVRGVVVAGPGRTVGWAIRGRGVRRGSWPGGRSWIRVLPAVSWWRVFVGV